MPYIQEIVSYLPVFYLQIAPFCVVIFLYLLSLACRNKRNIVWLLALTESLACTLFVLHEEGGVSIAVGYGFLLLSFILLFSPTLRLRLRKEKKVNKNRSFDEFLPAVNAATVLTPPPEPNVILKQDSQADTPMSEKKTLNDDVQLAHVFQVLKKLQGVKLSAGDRLETDVIHNMLTVYQAKESLSAEETRNLNNYLATLLKLMSKYSL